MARRLKFQFQRRASNHRRVRGRRGSAYLAILGACLLVAVIGVAATLAARVQLRTSELGGDVALARVYARSGVELARLIMAQDPAWRRNRPNGLWIDRQPIDRGTFTIEVTDPVDDDIANWPTDPVTVTVTGRVRGATQIETITLAPNPQPLSCLDVAAISDGSFTINSGTLMGNQTVATNGNFNSAGSSLIDCRVEAVGSINGSGYLGTRVSGAAHRTIPTSAAALDTYLANATPINYNNLGGGTMQDVLLSPQSNPFGWQTNPHGIYVVDCGGRYFGIRDSRIVGTLIVLNPRNDSKIHDSVHLSPAVPGFPSLLVRGPMRFEFGSADLVEGSGRNFNPPGAPYNGVTNHTTTDRYPSTIVGLVYVSGNATFSSSGAMRGVFVCGGGVTGTGTVTLNYDAGIPQNPPPGFADLSRMMPVPGTARRVVR